MVRKLTREIILEAIEEEFSKIDEVGMFSGIGSAIGGMAKDLKGKFHQHRAPAVAQKLAQKYQQELSDVSGDFVGIADSFEKDYTKWKANPFLKKMLDNLELIQSMELAAADVEQVGVKLDKAAQGNIEVSPAGEKTKANPEVDPKVAAAMKASTSGVVDKQAKDLEQSKVSAQMRKQSTGPQYPQPPKKTDQSKLPASVAAKSAKARQDAKDVATKKPKTWQEHQELLAKIKTILGENKTIRIINSNGRKK